MALGNYSLGQGTYVSEDTGHSSPGEKYNALGIHILFSQALLPSFCNIIALSPPWFFMAAELLLKLCSCVYSSSSSVFSKEI